MTRSLWIGAKDLLVHPPVYVDAGKPIRVVAKLLWASNVGLVVVTRNDLVCGVVSETDVIRALAKDADVDEATAGDVMQEGIVTVRPNDSVQEVATQMLGRGIRHLPIVDDFGALIGIVSLGDVLLPLLAESLGP